MKIKLKLFKVGVCVALLSCLSGCFNSEQAPATTGKQSAIEVKDSAQTLSLKPLRNQHFSDSTLTVNEAFTNKKSQIFIEDAGQVVKILADDIKGARHQKFLVKVATGQTLLFAHNIDLAPRVENIQVGDVVKFRGEYVYNPKGGVMHWTHHDPKNKIVGGWITHNNTEYK